MKRKRIIWLGILVVLGIATYYIYTILFQFSKNTVIDSSSEHYTSLEDILSNPLFKDKLLYVDIWGTRCPPCIAEFKHSKKLQEHFQTNDEVMFVYLCSPYGNMDDKVRWKFFINEYELTGHHIFMNENCYMSVYDDIEQDPEKRYLIPRYFIARNGKIILSAAPPPSSGNTIVAIDNARKTL
ncbi:TlpA family protein disulfide reductase [Parapedobacter lycopersici]|uniref:TlpA family protein disulfide reductase n=1 Tax=Parapedobacter lycopersici TaxID=1864939 RepID=UPI00214D8D1F|nr:hypothetical protein [Parapedobacter lycopersici]